MTRRHWIAGIAIGVITGFVIATAVTIIEWRLNPGGILHGEAGTNWGFVRDTWSSWFAPLFLVTSGPALVILWWTARKK